MPEYSMWVAAGATYLSSDGDIGFKNLVGIDPYVGSGDR